MDLKLHANATTTPRTRAYIQASTASVAELAAELGVSETTIRRWRRRRGTTDRSHTPHRLAISLSPIEEVLAVELRVEIGLSLDDIVEVMRRCVNPGLSRSAIHRTLRRHGVSRRTSRAPSPPPKASSTPPPSCSSSDASHAPDEFRVRWGDWGLGLKVAAPSRMMERGPYRSATSIVKEQP